MADNDNKYKDLLERSEITKKFEEAVKRKESDIDRVSAQEQRLQRLIDKSEQEAKEKFTKKFEELQQRLEKLGQRRLEETGDKRLAIIESQIERAKTEQSELISGGIDYSQKEKYESDLVEMQRGRMYGSQSAFERSVESATSLRQTASDIAKARRFQDVREEARKQAFDPRMTDISLSSKRENLQKEIFSINEQIREAAESKNLVEYYEFEKTRGGLSEEEAQSLIEHKETAGKLGGLVDVRSQKVAELAQTKETEAEKRRLGLDVSSRYYKASTGIEQISREIGRERIREDVAAGKFDIKDVEQQLTDTAKKLIESFSALDKAYREGAPNVEELTGSVEDLRNQYDQLKDVQKEVLSQGGGRGGGTIDRLGNIATGMRAFGAGASAFGQVYGYAGVTSEEQLLALGTGFAQRANVINRDIIGAAQGEASALRRFLTMQAAQESKRAEEARARQSTASGAEAVGGLFNVGGAVLDTAARGVGGFMLGGPAGAALGVASAAPGLFGQVGATTNQIIGMSKGLPQGQAALTRANLERQRDEVINALSDPMMQRGIDYGINLSLATRGFIGGAQKLPPNTPQPTALEREQAAMLGIPFAPESGPNNLRTRIEEEFLDISGIAKRGGMSEQEAIATINEATRLGTAFSGTGAGAARRGREQIEQMGRMAQAGLVESPMQAIQLQEQLTRSGVSAGESFARMKDIFKEAVSAGFTSAPAMRELVQYSAQTAKNTDMAALGRDVTGGASMLLSAGLGADDGRTEMQRLAGAGNFVQRLTESVTDTSLSFKNMQEFSRIASMAPDASLAEQIQALGASPATILEIEKIYGNKNRSDAEEEIAKRFPSLAATFGKKDQFDKLKRGALAAPLEDVGMQILMSQVDPEYAGKTREAIQSGDFSYFKDLLKDDKKRGAFFAALEGTSKMDPRTLIGLLTGEYGEGGKLSDKELEDSGAGKFESIVAQQKASGAAMTQEGMDKVLSVGVENIQRAMSKAAEMISMGDFQKEAEIAAQTLSDSSTKLTGSLDGLNAKVEEIVNNMSNSTANMELLQRHLGDIIGKLFITREYLLNGGRGR